MNITHAINEEVNGDKLEAIFKRQKELMEKYHDIEKRSGLMQTEDCPVNLDDKRGQARIKDFSWRVMEEVGEALDALGLQDKAHYHEELIDGLHFLTELTILSGFDIGNIPSGKTNDKLDFLFSCCFKGVKLDNLISMLVESLGMMCNCLKNKPWKQTNMVTDKDNFYAKLQSVWSIYISILNLTMGPDEVVDIYLKKSQVNKFRQRSNY